MLDVGSPPACRARDARDAVEDIDGGAGGPLNPAELSV
jgi:hypothetical protein